MNVPSAQTLCRTDLRIRIPCYLPHGPGRAPALVVRGEPGEAEPHAAAPPVNRPVHQGGAVEPRPGDDAVGPGQDEPRVVVLPAPGC